MTLGPKYLLPLCCHSDLTRSLLLENLALLSELLRFALPHCSCSGLVWLSGCVWVGITSYKYSGASVYQCFLFENTLVDKEKYLANFYLCLQTLHLLTNMIKAIFPAQAQAWPSLPNLEVVSRGITVQWIFLFYLEDIYDLYLEGF